MPVALDERAPGPGAARQSAGLHLRRESPPYNEARLGYWLERACHDYRVLMDEVLDELGLAPGQESLLTEIERAEPAWSQERLARRLGVRRQTVTRSIGRLEHAGMVERRALRDRRQRRIALTPHGRIVVNIMAAALRNAEADLADTLGQESVAALTSALREFSEAAGGVLAARRAPSPPLDASVRLRDYSPVMMNSGAPLNDS